MRFGLSIGATEDPALGNPWDAVYRQASMAEEAGFDLLTAAHPDEAWNLFTQEVMPVFAG